MSTTPLPIRRTKCEAPQQSGKFSLVSTKEVHWLNREASDVAASLAKHIMKSSQPRTATKNDEERRQGTRNDPGDRYR